MSWNGLDLQTEFSELLGDTSAGFKLKVLGWMNDICKDIGSKYAWPALRFQGVKNTNNTNKQQSLLIAPPSAPTVTLASGGTLVNGSVYSVAITFFQGESKTQSRATESAELTASASDGTINITAISVSTDPLVTARKVYLSKDGGKYFLVGTIDDNSTATYTISADTTSTFCPPDYDYIAIIEGNISVNNVRQLDVRSNDQLNLLFGQTWPVAQPTFWAPTGQDRYIAYPIPLIGTKVYFTYIKVPNEIFADADSEIDLPISLKMVLKTGVKWMGSDYRDRDDQVLMKQRYDSELNEAISRFGKSSKTPMRVRDTQGTSDGFEVS